MLCCLLLQSINKSYGRMGGWAEDEIKMNSCDEKVAYNSEYATNLKVLLNKEFIFFKFNVKR